MARNLPARFGIKTVSVGATDPFSFVSIISALRRNEFVALLVDRPYGGSAVPVHFCGAETSFLLRAHAALAAYGRRGHPSICFTKAGRTLRFPPRAPGADGHGRRGECPADRNGF